MKSVRLHLLSVLAGCIALTAGCVKSNHLSETDICDSNRVTVMTATDIIGQLSYNNDTEKWVISASIPGTIDGVRTCIICGGLASDLKTPGLKVQFSGELKESNGYPKPQLGGQEIYYVRPVKIRKW